MKRNIHKKLSKYFKIQLYRLKSRVKDRMNSDSTQTDEGHSTISALFIIFYTVISVIAVCSTLFQNINGKNLFYPFESLYIYYFIFLFSALFNVSVKYQKKAYSQIRLKDNDIQVIITSILPSLILFIFIGIFAFISKHNQNISIIGIILANIFNIIYFIFRLKKYSNNLAIYCKLSYKKRLKYNMSSKLSIMNFLKSSSGIISILVTGFYWMFANKVINISNVWQYIYYCAFPVIYTYLVYISTLFSIRKSIYD
ncbi:hypothetical protein DY138_00640 [Apilactobacillus timberlakei]|uniref:hypothetical protein n=1 Tax=Apilactobacillus timberlakei TaxID=2008380 RepID=UPI00112A0F2D|nr:hypothetical protein [Apilactobacillus timberlakei]TPR19977.1 hypothetical protein DY138_00640 [Apilactobacillus timberlakei]TPR21695.1 hypothetical protein DY061_00555 [Apilactobacillus timberlakei]TPR22941.1 hypothetical protein DY083_02375 [Apilactobacillus timberlakei]